jgi:hypothetical protein
MLNPLLSVVFLKNETQETEAFLMNQAHFHCCSMEMGLFVFGKKKAVVGIE